MTQPLDLKKLRSVRGWTQQETADYFGVDKATIWRWENEGIPSRGPSRRAIERELSALCGVPYDQPPEAA